MKARFVPQYCTLLAPILMVWTSAFAAAQTGASCIIGTVWDSPSTTRVPGASITVISETTNLSGTAITNHAGLYEVPFLAAGRYTVRAEKPGFATAAFSGIEVNVREVARVDFKLKPEPDAEQDVGKSVRFQLTMDSSETECSLPREEFANLPLQTRDFASLLILSPGVQPGSSVGGFAGRQLSEGFRIAGGTMYSGSFSVEQADNNRSYYYGNASSPSLEIVQGVSIQMAGASSEFGGGVQQVDVSLRGGSRKFHGSIFEYMQHDRMSAANAMSGADPPHLRRSQFGASMSGPLRRDRLFVFGVFEGIRQREGEDVVAQVATSEQREGIFPLTGADAVTIKDPLTNKPFPGNQIPAARLSPVARYFLDNVWPLPNSGTQLYRLGNVPAVDSNQVDVKIDYIREPLNAVSIHASRQKLAFDHVIDQPLVSPRIDRFDNLIGSIRYTRTIRPGMVNTLLISARRDYGAALSYSDLGGGDRPAGQVGMSLGGPSRPGLPLITISGRGFAGHTGQLNTPAEHSGNVFQYLDTLCWMTGRHGLSLGFEVKRFQNSEMDDGAASGQISFNGRYSGSGLADFFLGLPNQVTFVPEMGRTYLRNTLWSAYVHDDWKVRDNLSLNLGVRYEYLSWPSELYDRMSTSHPELGMQVIVSSATGQLPGRTDPVALASYPPETFVPASQAGLPRSLRFPDRNNFGPRFGFAYRVAGDTVIRGGYGIDYVRNTQATFSDRNASFGLPFRISRSVVNPNPLTFSILQPFADFVPKVRNVIDSAWYFDPHLVMAYVQTWSLNIESKPTSRSVLRFGYVGNRMVHGRQTWNWNQSLTWPNRNNRFAGYTNVLALTNGGDSRYDSLQAQFRNQVTRGLVVYANYTWSKTLTNIVDDGDAYSIWVHDPAMQWGRSRWDRTHVFTANFAYRLPSMKDIRWMHFLHPVVEGIAGGWQLSGIVRVMSGMPLTITSSLAKANLSVQGIVPADRLADGRLDHPNSGRWFDDLAFGTPPANRPGNAGYGVLDGPGFVTEDLALYKSFRVQETTKLQLRLEAYNALNHANLGDPTTDVDNRSLLGKIYTSGPALHLQAALRLEF